MAGRLNLLRDAEDQIGKFVSKEWVRKNILKQTDEDIDELDKQIKKEAKEEDGAEGEEGEMGGYGANGSGQGPEQPAPQPGGAPPQMGNPAVN